MHDEPHPDRLYVENVNRWVARSRPGSNRGLAEVAPPDFAHTELPRLPGRYSPRTFVGRAREAGSFHTEDPRDLVPAGPARSVEYVLDVTRDLNGAGLVYFAAYFSIFDTAVHGLWRSLGRSDRSFLRRRVVDQKLGYFGNADPGAVFTVSLRRWHDRADPRTSTASRG
ncbi:LnmK family bifunctional acyltransferase/decarboxylase [Kitasatospora sp. NPDC094019]|uniref:LnmK family bifunctional acyltransferase/decarboxylase n=1 Tax=Kitasatospora sp. NPDC094019 TaxID=3364091 RepID=UPI00382AB3AD